MTTETEANESDKPKDRDVGDQSVVSVPLRELTTDQLRTAHQEIRDEIWEREHVDRRESNAQLIGNCYRYRNNYGRDCEGWWLYHRVTHIDGKGQLHGISFQDDTQGKMSHEISYMSESSLGDPITREEWDTAFSEFRKQMEARSR